MKKVILLTLLLTFICGVCSASARYQWIFSNDNYGYFFDTQTVKFNKDDGGNIDRSHVDAWIKIIYSDSGRQKTIEKLESSGVDVSKYDDLAYSLGHYAFNIRNNQYYLIAIFDYSKDGTLIRSVTIPVSKRIWKDTVPSSAAESWEKTISNYINDQKAVMQ